MSPPCDASAGGRQQELQRSLENLNQEPETDEEERVDFEEQRDEKDRHHHDDPRQGEEAHVASQHSRDCTGGAQCRHDRCWIKKDMRNRGSKAASEIKGEIASVTQPILHRGSEQPERPHVENEMQPAAVEKHHAEEGKQIGGRELCLAICQRGGVARRDEREVAQEFLELRRAQAVLEEENQAIGRDQQPGYDRRVTGGNGVSDRNHVGLRLSERVWRMPDKI